MCLQYRRLRTVDIHMVKPERPSSDTQEQLRQRVDRLERELDDALRQQQAMMYTLSHDLRTPVMTILGFTDMLIADLGAAAGQEQAVHYLQNIRQSAVRQSKIIDELLKLSRLLHCELKLETVDLMELAQASAERLRQAEPGRRVETTFETAAPAYVDRELFTTVMDALLGNAWKFTGKRADAAVSFTVTRDQGEPVYCVADNGVGFEPLSADRLFQPLKRLHSDKEFPGAGMGLATAAAIIRRHDGRIWAEATPGTGARFHFTLAAPGSPS